MIRKEEKQSFGCYLSDIEIKVVSLLGRVFNLDYQKGAKKINFEQYFLVEINVEKG